MYVFAETVAELAGRLNQHNASVHPVNYTKWTEAAILDSCGYEGPLTAPSYLTVRARSAEPGIWGGAKAPYISVSDREFLEEVLVKWE